MNKMLKKVVSNNKKDQQIINEDRRAIPTVEEIEAEINRGLYEKT